jgi:methenyltetrahydromethanopterin cyclohydrolase
MPEKFKVSRNSRSYNDITQNIIHSGVYEIDLVEQNKNRNTQMKQVNDYVTNGQQVYLYITDSKHHIYKGEVISKFERNYTNPFYLDSDVQTKSKNYIDISNHPFYTCNVNWNLVPLSLSERDSIKKCYPKFLAKTIVKLNND